MRRRLNRSVARAENLILTAYFAVFEEGALYSPVSVANVTESLPACVRKAAPLGEEIERQLRHRRPPKLAQNGFEHGTDLAAGFRPQFWGRIPANVMNYYWRPDSGRQMAAGIWPPNGGQNPARGLARVALFSGTTGASRHAHSSAHMRFGSALHILLFFPHMSGDPPGLS